MQVFAEYRPENVELFRLWERSWAKFGWVPGIISPREKARHGSIKAAVLARGGRLGLLCSPRVINYGFRAPRKTPARLYPTRYGTSNWETSPLVVFPEAFSEMRILSLRLV